LQKSWSFKGKARNKVRNILDFCSVARAFYWYSPLAKRDGKEIICIYTAQQICLFFTQKNYTCPPWRLTKFCSHFLQFLHGNIVLLANDSLVKLPSGLMDRARKNIFRIDVSFKEFEIIFDKKPGRVRVFCLFIK